MKLRPFSATVQPAGRAAFVVEGRMTSGGFCVCALERTLILPALTLGTDLLGPYVLVQGAQRSLGSGLWLRVEPAQRASDPPLRLVIEPASAAGERAAPLFARIGGDAALVRLIAPPRWSAELEFGADGTLRGFDEAPAIH